MKENILKAVKEVREKSKKRNFPQTFDLIVSLKEIDIKKSENKINLDYSLPQGRGIDANIIVFSDTLKTEECEVFNSAKINNLAKNKREAKKLVSQTDFFLSEPKLMPVVAKAIGQLLGPRNKLPKIITGDLGVMVKSQKKSIRIRIKDSSVIQCMVGKENMDDNQIVENIEGVVKFLEKNLPKGKININNFLLKFTMGKPVKVGVYG